MPGAARKERKDFLRHLMESPAKRVSIREEEGAGGCAAFAALAQTAEAERRRLLLTMAGRVSDAARSVGVAAGSSCLRRPAASGDPGHVRPRWCGAPELHRRRGVLAISPRRSPCRVFPPARDASCDRRASGPSLRPLALAGGRPILGRSMIISPKTGLVKTVYNNSPRFGTFDEKQPPVVV